MSLGNFPDCLYEADYFGLATSHIFCAPQNLLDDLNVLGFEQGNLVDIVRDLVDPHQSFLAGMKFNLLCFPGKDGFIVDAL